MALEDVQKRYSLAAHHLETAGQFLDAAIIPVGVQGLQGCCVGLELTLKAYLLRCGVSDEACRTSLRHDLGRALRLATVLCAPEADDALVTHFAAVAGERYACHDLEALSAAEAAQILSGPSLLALRRLRGAIAARLADDLTAGRLGLVDSVAFGPAP